MLHTAEEAGTLGGGIVAGVLSGAPRRIARNRPLRMILVRAQKKRGGL